MPLRWQIAPLEHMVVCVAEGVITLSDILGYFAALKASGAWRYRRIVDVTRATGGMSDAEVAEIVARVKAVKLPEAPAPMALVTGSRGNDVAVEKIRTMMRPGRRMREFATIHEARIWLDRVARMEAARKTGRPVRVVSLDQEPLER